MKLRISYGLMAIVLVGAMWAGTHRNRVPTSEERALALEQTIKCPVCRGQSVAESDSEASKAIRIEITRRISAGQSDSEIRGYFAQTLGDDVLLRPASSGFGGLVWVLPVAGFVVAGSGIVLAFVRWRRWGDT
ncbi:MAG: cytochrome c-type biosis protein CcmH [Acidimicrobiaceae bacterium]